MYIYGEIYQALPCTVNHFHFARPENHHSKRANLLWHFFALLNFQPNDKFDQVLRGHILQQQQSFCRWLNIFKKMEILISEKEHEFQILIGRSKFCFLASADSRPAMETWTNARCKSRSGYSSKAEDTASPPPRHRAHITHTVFKGLETDKPYPYRNRITGNLLPLLFTESWSSSLHEPWLYLLINLPPVVPSRDSCDPFTFLSRPSAISERKMNIFLSPCLFHFTFLNVLIVLSYLQDSDVSKMYD